MKIRMNTHTLINCIVAIVVLHYVTLAKNHSVNELDSPSDEESDIGLLNTSTIT